MSGGGTAVWRKRNRLQRLESEIAAGKAERAELRRRLEMFETLAAAAGADVSAQLGRGPWRNAPVPSAPLPPALLAASRDLRSRDVPVKLNLGGAEVVAVVGGAGDPREWWTAMWQLAGPGESGPKEASG